MGSRGSRPPTSWSEGISLKLVNDVTLLRLLKSSGLVPDTCNSARLSKRVETAGSTRGRKEGAKVTCMDG